MESLPRRRFSFTNVIWDTVQLLQQRGWTEGKNLSIDLRWPKGSFAQEPSLVSEVLDSKVDVIVAWATPSALAARRATSTIPIVFLGNAWGHDFDFHVPLWMEAARQFQHGILYPRWATGANGGFGEPSTVFYPPLSWMTGGLLGLILPWRWVPCAYLFLVFVLAGASMWKLASDWLEPPDALMARAALLTWPGVLPSQYTASGKPRRRARSWSSSMNAAMASSGCQGSVTPNRQQ